MKRTEAITCSASCASALREDRRAGLIYGPYGEKQQNGTVRYVSQEQFCAESNTCAYCGSTLPRGRAKRIRNQFVEKRAEYVH